MVDINIFIIYYVCKYHIYSCSAILYISYNKKIWQTNLYNSLKKFVYKKVYNIEWTEIYNRPIKIYTQTVYIYSYVLFSIIETL